MLTNDLNDREDQIIALKQKEKAQESAWATREKHYESEAAARMLLNRKLQQILIDKEDALDQVAHLKVICFCQFEDM